MSLLNLIVQDTAKYFQDRDYSLEEILISIDMRFSEKFCEIEDVAELPRVIEVLCELNNFLLPNYISPTGDDIPFFKNEVLRGRCDSLSRLVKAGNHRLKYYKEQHQDLYNKLQEILSDTLCEAA